MITWVDGQPASGIPADDRGFAYGDGLFETMAVGGGHIRLLDRHLGRASLGCTRLGFPPVDWRAIRVQIAELLSSEPVLAARGVLRMTVTRGAGAGGYRPGPGSPRTVLSLRPRPPAVAEPVRLRWCRTPVSENTALAGIKHLNRLAQVLARAEWNDETVFDGLMCDRQGRVACGTMTNVFIVTERRLLTPDLSSAGVAGVMRACVLEGAAALEINTTVCRLDAAAVTGADEVFVTNAVRGIVPVAGLDRCRFDAPGPVTRELRAWLDDRGWPC